jgi:transcriptional regulator with XRE-family HTH domain
LPILVLLGDVVRTTRLRLGWTQRELSRRSGVPQSQISQLERHRISDVRLTDVDSILVALGVRYRLILDPPIVEARMQADLVHARCSAHVERRLQAAGWRTAREVEIGSDRSRGWIDLLAWHPGSRVLLVVEIKSEIHDLGAIERTMNWYEREAWAAARRLGWLPRRVGSALLVLQSEANDRTIAINRDVLAAAFPQRADALARVVGGATDKADGRTLAMIDPRSRRVRWLRQTRVDGRRTAAPYADYIDAVRTIEQGSGRRSTVRLTPRASPHS